MYCKIGTCHYNDILYLLLYIVYHIAVIILKFYKELEKSFSEIEKYLMKFLCVTLSIVTIVIHAYIILVWETFIRNNILQ